MAEAGFWQQTKWWKSASYDVLNGTHIGPIEDLWDTYNPVEEHKNWWKSKKQERQPPYVELARVDLTDPHQIAHWCGGYGLLGILPHRTVEAYVLPRATGEEEPPSVDLWYRRDISLEIIRGRLSGREDPEPSLNPPRFLETPEPVDEPALQPYALITGQDEELPYEVDLVEGIAQFFPEVDIASIGEYVRADPKRSWGFKKRMGMSERDLVLERVQGKLELESYPIPFTEKFALQYREPIYLFREYAERIKRRLAMWQTFKDEMPHYGSIQGMLEDKQWVHLRADYDGFSATLGAVSPVVQFSTENGGTWSFGWRISSLYAAMHVMMLLDFTTRGRFVKSCEREVCGQFFFTNLQIKKYCSWTCKRTAQQGRRREREQERAEE